MSVLSHSESKLYSVCVFYIPDSLRKILKIFENCSQPDGMVGKPDHSVH